MVLLALESSKTLRRLSLIRKGQETKIQHAKHLSSFLLFEGFLLGASMTRFSEKLASPPPPIKVYFDILCSLRAIDHFPLVETLTQPSGQGSRKNVQ